MGEHSVLFPVKFPVTLQTGETETLELRPLPLRKMELWLGALTDEAKMIDLATGKPSDWVDSLSPESANDLVQKVEEINRDFFYSWLRRRISRAEEMEPGSAKQYQHLLQKSVSTSGSRESASSPG